jgi:large subunit GTPase 1
MYMKAECKPISILNPNLFCFQQYSDVVVQILDARNPLLFRCEDLETYVKEVNPSKRNLLLVNKADFLTERQRELWSEYFDSAGISAVFFSATAAAEETILEVM